MAFSTFLMFFLQSLPPAGAIHTGPATLLAVCAVDPRTYPHDVHVYQAAKGMDTRYDVLLQ